MRIATCGGETKWSSFLLAHLAAEWLNRGRDAIVIDASPEQELVSYLRISPSLMSRLPRLGEEGFRIKEYLQRNLSGIKASDITEFVEPSTTGRQIECSSTEPLIACFSAEFSYPQLYPLEHETYARLISLGSCDSDNITAQQRHHQALSIFLNHLADQPTHGIFMYLGSGQLPCITGLLGRVDLAISVSELAENGDTDEIIGSMQKTLDRLKTPTVSFQGEGRADWEDENVHSTESHLLETEVSIALPGAAPHRCEFRDAAREVIDFASALHPDPTRFTRNNELMAQLGGVASSLAGETARRSAAS